MLEPLSSTIHGVIEFTWPMILISVIILVSFRVTYLIKNKEKMVLYKELLMLSFIIYILCLFQVVTFQDDVSWSTNNFIPFREIFRYKIGSRLFLKNILGNMLLFLPFGFFTSHYIKIEKPSTIFVLTFIASVSIESVQMAIGRVFDVDDIILNICGGFIGYYIYAFMKKVGDKLPKFMKSEVFLNIVSIVILLGVITLI